MPVEYRRYAPMDERTGPSPRRRRALWLVLAASALCTVVFFAYRPHESASSVAATTDYRNFESLPVHPVALTPDGTRLLALNLPDAHQDWIRALSSLKSFAGRRRRRRITRRVAAIRMAAVTATIVPIGESAMPLISRRSPPARAALPPRGSSTSRGRAPKPHTGLPATSRSSAVPNRLPAPADPRATPGRSCPSARRNAASHRAPGPIRRRTR